MWGEDIKIAGFSSNSRGVAILSKSIGINYKDTRIDVHGNYVIASVVINGVFEVILANAYGSNLDNPIFFARIWHVCKELQGDKEIPFICGEDFNMTLNIAVDASNYVHQNNKRATEEVLKIMAQNKLIDIYRTKNGDRRMFTWKIGNPVTKRARLDYFLVSESLIYIILEACIILGYRSTSDHSIFTVELNLAKHERGKGFYKMNTSLLFDKNMWN